MNPDLRFIASQQSVPSNAYFRPPDGWHLAGITKCVTNAFEHQSLFTDGKRTLSESEMFVQGIACLRVDIQPFTVRDYTFKR